MGNRLIKASGLVAQIMESLTVAELPPRNDGASYGFFSLKKVSRQVRPDACTLLVGKPRVNGMLNIMTNMTMLCTHPSILVALDSDPLEVVVSLLSLVSGIDVTERKVPPVLWPNVEEAAADLWRAPLHICQPKTMDLKSLDSLAARAASRGIIDLFIDSPALLRAKPRKPFTRSDFPEICNELCALARKYEMAVVGTADVTLSEAARLVDTVIRVEDFGRDARFGLLRRGETRPTFSLARGVASGRYNDPIRVPWGSSTSRRFEAARSA